MAKLTTKQRKAMPASEYALPGKRYPVNDKNHAVAAKSRATQQVKAGNLTPAAKSMIDAKANRVLGKKGSAFAKAKARMNASSR